MMTMDQSLKTLCERGIISYEDAIDHAFDPKELQRLMGRA
jgi:Tfp pilus assembly ATPase PilU